MTLSARPHRPIRSFVRRESRITPAQERALKELWPRYGIEAGEGLLDFAAIFGRHAPVILEIGFGNGEALVAMAAAHPENDYLGIEVHRPGVGALLRRLATENLANVHVLIADAKDVLDKQIPDASLAAVHVFFPDPWPKKRHHKRRLVQRDFAGLIARKLARGGYIHLATDWPDYAEHMKMVLSQTTGLVVSDPDRLAAMTGNRPSTKFERRGQRLGHPVRDLVFHHVGTAEIHS